MENPKTVGILVWVLLLNLEMVVMVGFTGTLETANSVFHKERVRQWDEQRHPGRIAPSLEPQTRGPNVRWAHIIGLIFGL